MDARDSVTDPRRRRMARLGRRVGLLVRRHPTAADMLMAVALAAGGIVSLYAWFEVQRQDPHFHEPATTVPVVAVLAVMLPLALRRRLPLAAAAAVIIAFVVGRARLPISHQEQYLAIWACWLALYSAAVHGRRTRTTTLALAVLAAALLGEIVRELFFDGGIFKNLPLTQGALLAYNVAVVIGLPLLLGLAVRALRERQRQLAAQATELQREREENARRAVLEERVRIARELHDVVAHHVSVMGVQAGAARRVMQRRPDKAEEMLSAIEASSRRAVAELHRLLGFLRRADQPDELAPQPDLAQLDELVAQASAGGLSVDLVVEGEQRALPRTLELSAYRVIQEALTNTRKHSGGSAATVRLGYRPTTLEVEVVDDGDGRRAQLKTHTRGHGLIGIRERVALHGGHLRAGPRQEGGFAVHASFPVNGQRS
jgi:signal transduction histidine kinase